jgi:uncharacterized membrane protein YdjX (TVP38/TMEM64 family)
MKNQNTTCPSIAQTQAFLMYFQYTIFVRRHYNMRLFLLFIGLAVIVLGTFFIWGDQFMEMFSHNGTVTWLSQYGKWAWVVAVLLLMADLFLPLPATIIISALGYIYGPIAGGLISTVGSFMAGSLGYWLCRLLGEQSAVRLLGRKDYLRGKKLSGKIGGWVVALSRWLPVFPEVISCMAGLTRMPATYFHGALFCGSLPFGFVYAYVGYTGVEDPWLAIVLSAALPPLIWFAIRPLYKSSFKQAE